MTSAFIATITHDGHCLARDPLTGIVASARTLDEAFAELRRLTASHAHTCEDPPSGKLSAWSCDARHQREGAAA